MPKIIPSTRYKLYGKHSYLTRASETSTKPSPRNKHSVYAEALSFWRVKEKVREELLNYFKDEYSPSSALYAYQDELHLKVTDEQELIKLLADRSVNPDYDYTVKLFQKYREGAFGCHNGKAMFKRLAEIVQDYNSSGYQRAVAINFCIAIFNVIPSLKPDDRMIYSYIAFGYVSQDSLFYASL
ncbi:hypothetical protein C1646_674630 [Rhizophagus diaphanus]|nr:hypothetical protein C1646_674630 [Rhizophagus diaphanus] [Rhizophagus sp. MUCL 43196]